MKWIVGVIVGILVINAMFVIFALTKASGEDERKRENEEDSLGM